MFQVSRRSETTSADSLRSLGSRGSAKWTAPTIIKKNRSSSASFTHISRHNILPLKDDHGRQQQTSRIRAADTCVVPHALPWNFRFEYVAPEVHIGCEKVRA